jgi:hypothetical protein
VANQLHPKQQILEVCIFRLLSHTALAKKVLSMFVHVHLKNNSTQKFPHPPMSAIYLSTFESPNTMHRLSTK